MRTKKAQVYTYELLIVMIFIALLFFAIFYTHYKYYNKMSSDLLYEQMKKDTTRAVDVLMNSQGYPEDWINEIESVDGNIASCDFENIKSLGLYDKNNSLMGFKLLTFLPVLNAFPEETKNLLGLNNYLLSVDGIIFDKSGSYLGPIAPMGDVISADNTDNIFVLKRNLNIGDNPILITFTVARK